MNKPKKPVEVFCRKCGDHLVGVLPGAKVFCPKCKAWTLAKARNGEMEG